MAIVWILVSAGVGGLGWFGFRTEAHWVAKDGKAFSCKLQYFDANAMPTGRWRDARAVIDVEHLIVRPRGAFKSAGLSGHYLVLKRTEHPPPGRATFLIDGEGVNGRGFAVVRVPAASRAVANIESLIAPR